MQNINRFYFMTKYLDNCFRNNEHSLKSTHQVNFSEIKIWENLIRDSELRPDDELKYICLSFGDT
jgi:hypothetical protein